ncbi:MAG: HlyD family secretion protein [Oscillospiraceae bacterium]|jgi:multidrug resistance efflux pump|nr:HlyD family secretion protein [Oscillospiraceae bacterium]
MRTPDSKPSPVSDFLKWVNGYVERIKSRTPPWSRWAALGLAATIILGELVLGWGMSAPELNLPAAAAKTQTRRLTAAGSGITAPYEKGIIASASAGSVKTVFHSSGDLLRQGDLVALLENEDAARALDQTASALEAAKAAVAPALSSAAPAVIVSPVSGRIAAMRGLPGEAITAGACARIAVDGATSVSLPDTALAVAIGETVRVEANTASGVIESDGVVVERELGRAIVRVADARFTEGQTVIIYDPQGNYAGSGTLDIYQAALVWGVSGVIRTAHASAGDWIEEGQPLFTLEGPLSVPGYETQMQTLETAASDAAQARRNADALSVYAPSDGILTGMTLKTGDRIREGETLGMLIDAQYRAVEITITPEWFDVIREGQPAIVTIGDNDYDGTVVSAEGSAVIVALDISAPLSAPASVLIDTGVDREGIWLPDSAVKTVNGTAYVQRAPAAEELPYSWLRGPLGRLLRPADSAVVESIAPSLRIPVTLGARTGDMVEITSGLHDKDVILE